MFKYIILFLLFSISAFAGVTPVVERFVADDSILQTNPGDHLIGIPRQMLVATEKGGIVAFQPGYGSSTRHLFYSANLDNGWNDTLIGYLGTPTYYTDHTHLGIDYRSAGGDSDFVYLAVTNGSPNSGSLMYDVKVLVNENTHQLSVLSTGNTSSYVKTGHFTVYRAAIQPLIGTDSVIMVSRGHDNSGDDSLDIVSFISADGGATWSDTLRVENLIGASGVTRIGAINRLKVGGAYTVSAIVFSNDHIEWWDWNRATHVWDKNTNDPISSPRWRTYGFAVVNDTIQFVVCPNGTSDGTDSLRWAYKSVNSATWITGKQAMDAINSNNPAPEYNLCVNSYGRLMLFYSKYFAAYTDSSNLACMQFDFTDSTFKDEIIVNDTTFGRVHTSFTSTYYVPSSHGDVGYVLYESRDAENDARKLIVGRVSYISDAPKKYLQKASFKKVSF